MPYKDPAHKKEWERLHRAERSARRRQLRQIKAAEQEPLRNSQEIEVGSSAVLIPLIAVSLKKDWVFWLGGCVILMLVFFLYWRKQQDSKAVLKQNRIGS